MKTRTKVIIGAAAVAGVVAAVPLAASAGGDGETPITGDALTRASEAAITHMGGGTVTDTEIGDEESMYEVEVTMPDGRQVDVQLDEGFQVVGTEDDGTVDDESSDGDQD